MTAIDTDKRKIRIRLIFNNPVFEFEKMCIIPEMQQRHVSSHTQTHTQIYIFVYLFMSENLSFM